MDTPQVRLPAPERPAESQSHETNGNSTINTSVEVDMGGTQELTEPAPAEDSILPDAQPEPESVPEPPTPAKKIAPSSFFEYILISNARIASFLGTRGAHQNLVLKSPFLKQLIDEFDSSSPQRIELPSEDVEAFSSFLEYQYTKNYSVQIESDESSDGTDESGELLLRHARVYTLAEKLGMPKLKEEAHNKIHSVNSTPIGELTYARYVYTHTNTADVNIRRPVAYYWATQGHIIRHDLKDEFRLLCNEVPEFSYDVLSLMMDRKEKETTMDLDSNVRSSARKRPRQEK
ncbi:uncharacterized protein N7483_004705 [Penicillium malachiteum]|uniref:uncharacterized protein n=1 Tax=Penicillium malachiteum TaxID=1324776 RepID=UPI002548B049|nr:uncharacterized protein N7483_004705 [Penicillium malachiteum]KAJ5730197.1 hypothetical protein N7483_004705 [Penicillium malachiteum]